MLRRFLSSHLKTLATSSSSSFTPRSASAAARFAAIPRSSRYFSTQSEDGTVIKKKVEDVMPIATGHEREELQAELEGRNILEIDHPKVHSAQRKLLQLLNLTTIKGLLDAQEVKVRMSMMLSGFGWRKASLMNVQCVHSILFLKW